MTHPRLFTVLALACGAHEDRAARIGEAVADKYACALPCPENDYRIIDMTRDLVAQTEFVAQTIVLDV